MHQLMGELGYDTSGPSLLRIDNQSAIAVSKNPEHHGKMKHLSLHLFWLRDAVLLEMHPRGTSLEGYHICVKI